MTPSEEVIALALKIADSCARSDVECNCAPVEPGPPWAWDLDTAEDEEVLESARYCEMRGLLDRDAERPNIVRFKERA